MDLGVAHVNSRKNILRGTLTNGLEWIFLILYLKPDGGALYQESQPVRIIQCADSLGMDIPDVYRPGPDLVAGILSHWVSVIQCLEFVVTKVYQVRNSFNDIEEDDWFKKRKPRVI